MQMRRLRDLLSFVGALAVALVFSTGLANATPSLETHNHDASAGKYDDGYQIARGRDNDSDGNLTKRTLTLLADRGSSTREEIVAQIGEPDETQQVGAKTHDIYRFPDPTEQVVLLWTGVVVIFGSSVQATSSLWVHEFRFAYDADGVLRGHYIEGPGNSYWSGEQ